MRHAMAELELVIPDYVSNTDVYKAVDAAANVLDIHHITAENLTINGLDLEAEEEVQHDDSF